MRRTKEEAEKTRLEILKAAIDVFSSKGFGASTLVDIAKKASVTRGAIYWHFKNKNDLFVALMEENESKVNDIIREIRDQVKNPIVALKMGLIEILKKLDSDPDYRAIENLLIKNKFSGEIDFIEERFQKSDFEGVCIMREIFQEYKDTCDCKNFNIDTAIKVVGSFVFGAMVLKLNARETSPFYIDCKIEEFVEMFFNGVGNYKLNR